MNFYLKQSDTDYIKFPVLPDSFEVSVSQKNTVVNVVSLGEVNLLGNSGLKAISLSSFFPARRYNFLAISGVLEPPVFFVNCIERWRNENQIVRLIITGSGEVLNLPVSIEDFSWGQRDATEDVYFTISLKEYRYVSVSSTSDRMVTKDVSAQTYKVKKGDTLGGICKMFYGVNTAALRDAICKANPKKLKNKTKLKKGMKLKIPAMKVAA